MSSARSRDDFLRFLDYLGEKGLVPKATVASRKATANKVTSILSHDEAVDVTAIDLEQVMVRFQNLNPHQYTPESLQTYASRMRTALDDFRSYCDNPLGFKPGGQTRLKSRQSDGPKKSERNQPGALVEHGVAAAPTSAQPLPNVNILPVQLRPDLVVQIAGLPFDLSGAEARKLANIILAHGPSQD